MTMRSQAGLGGATLAGTQRSATLPGSPTQTLKGLNKTAKGTTRPMGATLPVRACIAMHYHALPCLAWPCIALHCAAPKPIVAKGTAAVMKGVAEPIYKSQSLQLSLIALDANPCCPLSGFRHRQ